MQVGHMTVVTVFIFMTWDQCRDRKILCSILCIYHNVLFLEESNLSFFNRSNSKFFLRKMYIAYIKTFQNSIFSRFAFIKSHVDLTRLNQLIYDIVRYVDIN